jgi:predicted RNA-binding protein YlxR (DUF448 family)
MMLARIDDEGLDAGPRGAGSERLCAVLRVVKPTTELIRFVVGPDALLVPDLKRNLPGRGMWVTATCEALTEALKRKVFTRGFKAELQIPADFVEMTEKRMEQSALDALAIAGKARNVVNGFAKVEAALAKDNVTGLLHAREGAEDGKRKLQAVLRRRFDGEDPSILIADAFSSTQLDLALGRSNVVHAALLAGPASDGFLARYRRLTGFRTA